MKPPPFEYHAPTSLDEALDLLASLGPDAAPLAGGQSLVPLMNLRLARPANIVDINFIREFDGIAVEDARLTVGPLVRHSQIESSREALDKLPVLSTIIPNIGHPAIRHRGTVVGSMAHADPAAEWPCVAVALDAEVTLRRSGSVRTVGADGFFTTMLTTVKEPEELLTEVSFRTDFDAYGFYEFARRHGDFAIIAAMVALELDGDSIASARVSLAGASDRPLRIPEAEAAIKGRSLTPETADLAGEVAAEVVEPFEDIHGSSSYRKELVGVAVGRAMRQAGERS